MAEKYILTLSYKLHKLKLIQKFVWKNGDYRLPLVDFKMQEFILIWDVWMGEKLIFVKCDCGFQKAEK